MRSQLEDLKKKAQWLGTDLEEKDIELRGILITIIELLDIALPLDRSDDV